MKTLPPIQTLAAATVMAVAGSAALAQDRNDNQNNNNNSLYVDSDPKAVAEANAGALAASNNVIHVAPTTTSTATANGGTGVGSVTTELVNRQTFEDRLQAGVPPSIVVAPASGCGEGLGLAFSFVGGSFGTSFSNINFECLDYQTANNLVNNADHEIRAVGLASLGGLSENFEAALETVASTVVRCHNEMRASTSAVLLSTGRCGPMLRND